MSIAHYPEVTLKPAPRCQFLAGAAPGAICGAIAQWKRPGNHLFEDAYFCGAHRDPTDTALQEPLIVRRVRIQALVLFAGASLSPAVSQAEAIALLERAIRGVGGCLEVQAVSSALVRYGAPPPVGKGRGVRGGAE